MPPSERDRSQRRSTALAFWQRHWLAILIVITGVLALPADGPTFSANAHNWTLPGWIFGGVLIILAGTHLARSWRREES